VRRDRLEPHLITSSDARVLNALERNAKRGAARPVTFLAAS